MDDTTLVQEKALVWSLNHVDFGYYVSGPTSFDDIENIPIDSLVNAHKQVCNHSSQWIVMPVASNGHHTVLSEFINARCPSKFAKAGSLLTSKWQVWFVFLLVSTSYVFLEMGTKWTYHVRLARLYGKSHFWFSSRQLMPRLCFRCTLKTRGHILYHWRGV